MLLHIILSIFTLALGTLQGSTLGAMNNIAKPNCPTHCGNITVPYPFGIGNDTNCALDNTFYVTCNTSYEPPKLFLASTNIEIYNFSDSEVRFLMWPAYKCYNHDGTVNDEFEWWIRLGSPFSSFSQKNTFTVLGCDDYSSLRGTNGPDFSSGCMSLCSKPQDVPDDGLCSGSGCCRTSIPKGLDYYNITLHSFKNHTEVWNFNRCGVAFLGEDGSFVFHGVRDLPNDAYISYTSIRSTVNLVVDWVIAQDTRGCPKTTECKGNSSCYGVDGGGYHCRCNSGYEGNPYLDPGCQDINECEDPGTHPCYGDCINTLGSYNCTCSLGTIGDPKIENGCQHQQQQQQKQKGSKFSSTIYIPMVFGILAILFGVAGIIYGLRRKKLMELRKMYFERNGGMLLKQKINAQGCHEALTLFSTAQLRKATHNYSEDNIIGRGAHGVVYKGVLSDERVVAVKRSKLVDGGDREEFINEVLILTQVIHRNVVKLLGCCLEEEVPILVYEFVANNTLFHHIHSRSGGMSWLSWEGRLRVAIEAAGALAYLHSETIIPIIHRDVKSNNILLDENYTVKISDFGASRVIPLDHEQVTTLIQGTLGYLDPEYFNTSQLTEKSDVYSFGVVLAELITGKRPISVDRSRVEKSLTTYFVDSVIENRLYEIVEPRILREATLEQIQAVGDLVKRCLSLKGRDRPTMKEVVVELVNLRKFASQQETSTIVVDAEQSDLYKVPSASNDMDDEEFYSNSIEMASEINKPR